MRLFVAVTADDGIRRTVKDLQDGFRRSGITGNYTPAENLHLTLAFIGEFGDPDRVMDALDSVSFSPFRIVMDRIGNFGDLWWAGFREDPELEDLARRVRRALSDAGIPFDRKRFRPHVTMLRKGYVPRGAVPGPAEVSAGMTVDRISLMLSTRGKNGVIYTELGGVSASGER